MYIQEIKKQIESFFTTVENENFHEESGLTYDAENDVHTIGYCTNLTVETVEKANLAKVDLLLTHHDAWPFMEGLKEACLEKLKQYNISHYYIHLPLDDADFGTNASLVEALDLKNVQRSHAYEGFDCGRIGDLEKPLTLEALKAKIEDIIGEPVLSWQFHNRLNQQIGLVCGGGGNVGDIKEAIDKGCDVYITGEKVLYTIEYAQFKKINLIICSHTFSETLGVERLAQKIVEKNDDIMIKEIEETRLETMAFHK